METIPPRARVIRKTTKIEISLVLGLIMQAAGLIWGAAKLSTGVDNLNKNMEKMSDYSVLRYRVERLEENYARILVELQRLSGGK